MLLTYSVLRMLASSCLTRPHSNSLHLCHLPVANSQPPHSLDLLGEVERGKTVSLPLYQTPAVSYTFIHIHIYLYTTSSSFYTQVPKCVAHWASTHRALPPVYIKRSLTRAHTTGESITKASRERARACKEQERWQRMHLQLRERVRACVRACVSKISKSFLFFFPFSTIPLTKEPPPPIYLIHLVFLFILHIAYIFVLQV